MGCQRKININNITYTLFVITLLAIIAQMLGCAPRTTRPAIDERVLFSRIDNYLKERDRYNQNTSTADPDRPKRNLVAPREKPFKFKKSDTTHPLYSSCTVTFEDSFGSSGYDYGRVVEKVSDGGYVILGSTGSFEANGIDMYVIKLDSAGNKEWEKVIGGGGNDYGYSIAETTDGGYILAGSSNSSRPGSKGGYDIYLVKMKAGEVEWELMLGGEKDDEAYSVIETLDGGYVVAGRSSSELYDARGGYDVYLAKVKAGEDGNAGTLDWEKSFGGARDDEANSVSQTIDGGLIIAGSTRSYALSVKSDGKVHHLPDIYLIKTDSDGEPEWDKAGIQGRLFGGSGSEEAYSVSQTSDGGFILAGYTDSYSPDFTYNDVTYHFSNIYLVKTDSEGNPKWNPGGIKGRVYRKKLYGDYTGYSVSETSDDGYILLGSADFGDDDIKMYLVKLYADGEQEWSKHAIKGAIGYSVKTADDCGYILMGNISEEESGNNGWDIFVMKTDDNGNIDYFKDNDGDKYGNSDFFMRAESPPLGYVSRKGDCNDKDPAIHPKAKDLPEDGIDSDCDGESEELCNIRVPEDYSTIQAAINNAEEGDTVCVSDGVYVENINLGGKAITLRSENGARRTIIDGGGVDTTVTFDNNENANTIFDGFTIINGGNSPNGGGIKCVSAAPMITNCIISDNTAWHGGGIYLSSSSATITNCIISSNSATSGNGGGIHAGDSSTPTISNCTIRANSANFKGGGLYAGSSSPMIIMNCDISTNSADESGGGIHAGDASNPTIMSSIISGNTASGGGGIFCVDSPLKIRNSFITKNISKDAGGGVLCMTSSTSKIINCTVADNVAQSASGGGVFSYDTIIKIVSTIFWGNTAGANGNEGHVIGEGILEISFSNINTDEVFGSWTGDNNISENPRFTDSDNSDYHLKKKSPCIDMGTSFNAPLDDIDGDPRPQGDGVDIGADEYTDE